jgi:hypothetical protein
MKKLFVLIAVLAVASLAFAQAPVQDLTKAGAGLSYVPGSYTGYNTPRTTADTKLGMHDVKGTGGDRNGCQSCHVPHDAAIVDGWSTTDGTTTTNHTGGMYLWKYPVPTNIVGQDENAIVLDAASFHTLACLSCHDGATATNVIANNTMDTWAQIASTASQGLMNDHPVNAFYGSHGAATAKYVRLYAAGGTTNATGTGMVECGSCHDPHMGDPNTYAFLRGPGGTTTGGVYTAKTYTQNDSMGNATTYTGTSPQWARLGLCRDCHGK